MILSVIPFISAKHGGSAFVARNLHKLLHRSGHAVRLITTEDVADTDLPEVETMPLTCRPFFFSFACLVHAPREVRRADVLLVHNLYNFVSLYATLLAILFGRPYLFFPHGMLDRDSIYSAGSVKNILRWCYVVSVGWLTCRFARVALFNSEKERGNSFYGSRKNALVIPNGVDSREIRQATDALRSRTDEKTHILFLGRLNSIKGLDLIPEALSLLPGGVRDCIHVTLAGEGEAGYVSQLKKILMKHDVSHLVSWPGIVTGEHKYRLLANADIYLQPSKTEGLSISMLEAMASGVAMITTRDVGLADELSRRQAAYLIDYDASQLAVAIAELVQDVRQRESLAVNAAALVNGSYDWSIVGKRYMEVFRSLGRTCGNKASDY